MDNQGHVVTFKDMYDKIEAIDDKVNLLLERDKRDHERLQKVEKDLASVTKWVYFAALPLLLVVSVVLGIDKIPML